MTEQPHPGPESTAGVFSAAQVAQLLKPINPRRVLADGQGHSHVSQQDNTAHLIRVFGFAGFDTDIRTLDVVFEEPFFRDGKAVPGRWDVCYRATMRLSVKNDQGVIVAHYEDGSTGDAQNQKRAAGHDLAMKAALSLAIKRCSTKLGDQFGLSLYNKGQLAALVMATLVGSEVVGGDLQDGVTQQVAHGDTDDSSGPASSGRDWLAEAAEIVALEQPVSERYELWRSLTEEIERGQEMTPALKRALITAYNPLKKAIDAANTPRAAGQ